MVAWILITFLKIIVFAWAFEQYSYWVISCVEDIKEVWDWFKTTGDLIDFRPETLFFISSHLLLIVLTIIYVVTH